MITQQIFALSIISLASVTLLLGLISSITLFAYRRLVVELSQVRKKENEMKEAMEKDFQDVIKQAYFKAHEIINAAQDAVSNQNMEVERKLSELNNANASLYKVALEKLSHEQIEFAKKAFADTNEKINKQFDAFITARYQEDYQDVKEDLENYRSALKKSLDERAKLLIREAALSVLSKVITPEEHQELISKALEEAKQNHAF